MKVLNANIEEIHVRVKPIKTSYCLMLQSKALIPDDIYEVNILSCTMLTTYLYEVNIVSAGS